MTPAITRWRSRSATREHSTRHRSRARRPGLHAPGAPAGQLDRPGQELLIDVHVGDADNRRTFELLAADGFGGYFSVELINPPDPDAVLAHHIGKFGQFIEDLKGA